MPISADPPLHQPLVADRHTMRMDRQWFQWLSEAIVDRLNETPQRQAVTQLTAQAAAIGTTSLAMPTLGAGLYLIRYYARITQAATTSSSLTVTLAWEDGGVAQTESGAALTGNTTATHQSGVLMVRADASTALSFSTAYSSVGATPMQYRLDVSGEQFFLE